jgi:endonuclease/exonuclease/phosphatase family metal-dependent hydrolase
MANATFYRPALTLASSIHRSRSLCTLFTLPASDGDSATTITIGVGNCHLQGEPRRRNDRIAQAVKTLRSMQPQTQPLEAQAPTHVVICGDFNDEWQEAPTQTLLHPTKHLLKHACRDSSDKHALDWLMVSSYGKRPLPTYLASFYSGRIDMMLVSANMHACMLLDPF